MSEREPRRRRLRVVKKEESAWNAERIGKALTTQPEAISDETYGAGVRLEIGGPEQASSLEVYSEAAALRVVSPSVLLELQHVAPPRVAEEEDLPADHEVLIFVDADDEGRVRLSLTAEGQVNLLVSPPRSETPLPTPVRPTAPPQETPPAEPKPEERVRVALSGRLGADPTFRTTPKGVLVARFQLAVHEEQDSTTWHTVLAFGDRAEKLRGALRKGQEAQVVGYLHERDIPTREGGTRRVQEIYAALVQTR